MWMDYSLGHCFGGFLPFKGQLVLEALHLLLHLGHVPLVHGCSLMWGSSTCARRRRQGYSASMCRKALSSKADATPATAALSRERRRAHLIFKRSSVIPPTERSVQSREQTSVAKNCQIHSHTTGCVCLATTESLEQHVSSLRGGL